MYTRETINRIRTITVREGKFSKVLEVVLLCVRVVPPFSTTTKVREKVPFTRKNEGYYRINSGVLLISISYGGERLFAYLDWKKTIFLSSLKCGLRSFRALLPTIISSYALVYTTKSLVLLSRFSFCDFPYVVGPRRVSWNFNLKKNKKKRNAKENESRT